MVLASPLHRDEMDGWHCCPPGRGHRAAGWQPCYTLSVESHTDREAIEAVRYWWRRFRSLHFWQLRARREALRNMREARERAFASPRRPPPTPPAGLPPVKERRWVASSVTYYSFGAVTDRPAFCAQKRSAAMPALPAKLPSR